MERATDASANATFPLAEGKSLGYHPQQVEAFLERARASYDRTGQDGAVTAAEVRRTAFPLKRHGYSARFVDAAMDRLEEVFFERERSEQIRLHGEEHWWEQTGKLLSEVRGRLARPRGKRFRRRGIFATGYRREEVDAFLGRVSDMLAGDGQLSTSEVRAVVFHSQWRGYSEDEVDAFLDGVIELMLATL